MLRWSIEPLDVMLTDPRSPVRRLPADDQEWLHCTGAALLIPVVAHAGDGNTHPLVVVPRGDDAAKVRALEAFEEIMRVAISLDGTITGEHGVGRTKKSALPDQLGEDVMALSRRIKDALDPAGILNPGAVL